MRYSDFASIMTNARMNRYLLACDGNSRKDACNGGVGFITSPKGINVYSKTQPLYLATPEAEQNEFEFALVLSACPELAEGSKGSRRAIFLIKQA